MILFHNQVGVIAHRTHSVELTTTLDAVKTTMHWIIGLYAIPEEKRTGLVTHFYKDPVRRCFALETKEDWTVLKAEWVNVRWLRGLVLSQGHAELDQYMVFRCLRSDGLQVGLSWGIAGAIPTL
jgi:hypothetical protein